jgi:hypothetical protein
MICSSVNLPLRIVCLLGGEQNPNSKPGAFQGSRSGGLSRRQRAGLASPTIEHLSSWFSRRQRKRPQRVTLRFTKAANPSGDLTEGDGTRELCIDSRPVPVVPGITIEFSGIRFTWNKSSLPSRKIRLGLGPPWTYFELRRLLLSRTNPTSPVVDATQDFISSGR